MIVDFAVSESYVVENNKHSSLITISLSGKCGSAGSQQDAEGKTGHESKVDNFNMVRKVAVYETDQS